MWLKDGQYSQEPGGVNGKVLAICGTINALNTSLAALDKHTYPSLHLIVLEQ